MTLKELFANVRQVVYQLSDQRQNVVTMTSPNLVARYRGGVRADPRRHADPRADRGPVSQPAPRPSAPAAPTGRSADIRAANRAPNTSRTRCADPAGGTRRQNGLFPNAKPRDGEFRRCSQRTIRI